MGHDPMVTRLYSLRKPAPNVAAFGRAGEGHPRMSHEGKTPMSALGSVADIRAGKEFVLLVPITESSPLGNDMCRLNGDDRHRAATDRR